jgi:uncharacterized protein (TIGR03437 family)
LGKWNAQINWNGSPLVSLSFTLSAPVLTAVVNGGSFVQTAVAPGEIVALYGAGLGPQSVLSAVLSPDHPVAKTLGGTTVTFDNVPSPLIYLSDTQVGAVVPFGIAGKQAVQVQVVCNGAATNVLTMQAQDAAPGLFSVPMYDSSNKPITGRSWVAALNQDGSVNSRTNPTHVGDIISLFATGAGQTKPDGVDGLIPTDSLPIPLLPITVEVGGLPAKVLYAGAAPYLVSGLIQVNAQIPTLLIGTLFAPPSGVDMTIQSVVLTVGSRRSASNVYLSVVPGSPAKVQITFSPTIVNRSADGRWYYAVTLHETAGVGVTLTGLRVNGEDQTGLLAAFGDKRIAPGGQISGNLSEYCTGVGTCPFPGDLGLDFTGSDDHGNMLAWHASVHLQ